MDKDKVIHPPSNKGGIDMNYQDWQQNLQTVRALLGAIPVAGERHVGIMGQIFYLLSQMEDECAACLQQKAKEDQAAGTPQ